MTSQTDEAARTLAFSAERRLYFHTDTYTDSHYCYAGFSFIPAPAATYTAHLRLDKESCWTEVTDDATGQPPESLKAHDPLARHAAPYTVD